MAGHLVQSRSVEANTATPSLAFLSNVTAGSTLISTFAYFKTNPADFIGISDNNGNTLAQIGTEQASAGTRLLAYYAKNANAGATTVSPTTSVAHSNGLAIEEWSGLDTTAPLDGTPAGTTGATNAPDGGSVAATLDGIVWGACTHGGTGTVTIGEGASFTIGTEQESTTNMPIHTENRGDGGGLAAGSYSAPHTLGSSQTWCAITATFKAAAGAAAVPGATLAPARIPNRLVGPMALRSLKHSPVPFDMVAAPTTADYFLTRVRVPNNRVGPPVLRALYRPPIFPFDTSLSTATGNRLRRVICSGA
jgi:hypothetical protein